MSGGTKVALVALMVLMMVVIARLVDDESASGLGGSSGAGGPEGAGAKNGEAGAADGKVATQKPGAKARPSGQTPQEKPRTGIQVSANPARRTSSSSERATDPRRMVQRGSGSGRTEAAGANARTAPRGAPTTSRAAPGAVVSPGPITGDPSTGLGTGSGDGGLSTTRVAPVSVEGGARTTTGARNPLELARAAAQGQSPVVSTQLENGGASAGTSASSRRQTTPRSPATSGQGREPTATRLEQRTSGRETEPVGLKRYEVAKSSATTGKDTSPATSALATGFPVEYIIQPNDSLWKIAEKYYGGRGYLYPHIEKRNPNLKMHPGKTLVIPAPPEPSKRASEPGRAASAASTRRYGNVPTTTSTRATRASSPTNSRMHTVQKGETLWEIAARVYGDPTQYVRIKNANPQLKNADHVKAGTKILIP